MKAIIESRFAENIDRVRNLAELYRVHLMGQGRGRRGHTKTDVLRAAVVMLHAAMEDLLRSIEHWKLPGAGSDVLAKIPLASKAPAIKFNLGDLVAHRGQSIDAVISKSVYNHLERSNYNNADDLAAFCTNVGIDVTRINSHFPKVEPIMKRRHLIVHRADRDDQAAGRGRHRVTSIGVATVKGWISDIEAFGTAVLNEV